MDLRQLRYFMTVAEEGHVTRAAERLGMQQPPLSRQISALERALDVRLFKRVARGVELTDAGRVLLDEARLTIKSFDRAVDATKRAARGEIGRLAIGIAPTATFHPLVTQTVRDFRKAFPSVKLSLEEYLSDAVAERFAKDQLDLAFVRTRRDFENLKVLPLVEEALMVAIAKSSALGTTSAPIALKKLAPETFILYGPPGTGLYDETVAACRAAGFDLRIGQHTARFTSALGLVAAGVGVTVVPHALNSFRLRGVVYRALRGASNKSFLGLAFRRDDRSAVLQRFIAMIDVQRWRKTG